MHFRTKLVIFETRNLPTLKFYLEIILDKIGKNANYCLETLATDIEALECTDDFVQAPKRKRKSADPCKTPVKKRKPCKKRLLAAVREAEDDSDTPKVLAKTFLDDQAEGNCCFFII